MTPNLPQIKKNGILKKIMKYIRCFFKKDKEKELKKTDKKTNKINNGFIESLQVKSKDRILALQRRLKKKQIKISDLTNDELEEMIELYKKQIKEKDDKIKQYINKQINI